jgi:hypothetical protein
MSIMSFPFVFYFRFPLLFFLFLLFFNLFPSHFFISPLPFPLSPPLPYPLGGPNDTRRTPTDRRPPAPPRDHVVLAARSPTASRWCRRGTTLRHQLPRRQAPSPPGHRPPLCWELPRRQAPRPPASPADMEVARSPPDISSSTSSMDEPNL